MRQVLRIIAVILLAAMVFSVARYLDNNPRNAVPGLVKNRAEDAATEVKETVVLETTKVWESTPVETISHEETESQEERFLLTFVGDCTFGANPSNYYAGYGFIKTVGEDYGYPFRNVITWFENDECSFVNLEGPLTDEGNPVQKKHAFKGPADYVKILANNSIEAVTIANNHSEDCGQKGYESTVSTLEAENISYVERDNSCIFTTENGLKIGMYGAVYYVLDEEAIIAGISALKEQNCDLVIFAPHWGVEGTYHPTAEQEKLGHAAIDAGADIVWGSHPHVLQPIEEYNGGIIYYSLGNFSFGGNGYPRDYDTALLQQEVIRAADGTVTLGALTIVPASVSSIKERNNYQPTPCETGTEMYDRVLQKLDGNWTGANLSTQ